MRVVTVNFWAANGQKAEKMWDFDHLCWPLNFNVPLYNMTQLHCEWSHWFDFWFAYRALAPTFSDPENLALLWIVKSQSEDSRVKSPKLSDRLFWSFQQPWAISLGKCGCFSWSTCLCPATPGDEGGHCLFLSYERAERWENVGFWQFVLTFDYQCTSL